MSDNEKMLQPTLYAAELLEKGYTPEQIGKIIKQEHIPISTFVGTFTELMAIHNLSVDMVAGAAEIDPATIYRFMKQERNPSRNALLRICLAMELSLDETQRLLKSGNCSTLSITRSRDLVIMDGVIHKKDFVQVNEELTGQGFGDLNGRG